MKTKQRSPFANPFFILFAVSVPVLVGCMVFAVIRFAQAPKRDADAAAGGDGVERLDAARFLAAYRDNAHATAHEYDGRVIEFESGPVFITRDGREVLDLHAGPAGSRTVEFAPDAPAEADRRPHFLTFDLRCPLADSRNDVLKRFKPERDRFVFRGRVDGVTDVYRRGESTMVLIKLVDVYVVRPAP